MGDFFSREGGRRIYEFDKSILECLRSCHGRLEREWLGWYTPGRRLSHDGNSTSSIGLSAGPGSTAKCNTLWANVGTGLGSSMGSAVTQNTVLGTNGVGISVTCPANVFQNATTDNLGTNLVVSGAK